MYVCQFRRENDDAWKTREPVFPFPYALDCVVIRFYSILFDILLETIFYIKSVLKCHYVEIVHSISFICKNVWMGMREWEREMALNHFVVSAATYPTDFHITFMLCADLLWFRQLRNCNLRQYLPKSVCFNTNLSKSKVHHNSCSYFSPTHIWPHAIIHSAHTHTYASSNAISPVARWLWSGIRFIDSLVLPSDFIYYNFINNLVYVYASVWLAALLL